MRRKMAVWLRDMAAVVDPTSGPRCFAGHFNVVNGVGMVVTLTDGILVSPPAPGCPLYFMDEEYDRAHEGNG